ncbi:sulfurtransferase complex subunit TusC [Aliivibrio fischeri]|uniref:Protein TusC homolog n=1 Tax=Aliivibrio fischeri SR5 TaxID=1088719 RepID=A0AAV3EXY6_ALIFS|nr:sulfurtransferase complex subunit TusC [Aliivibrio fischeri]EHN71588.1 sulfur transfer protein complex, TusC subunit [Aliivibrio fischeri SR5]MCE7556904.1 sulfurtransferase complex subunit TusC [Aliivibrio fischeri]MCE7563362.1 sulfurtransferase complex subunit TusC [Aliivibrio fischeri]MCE7566263.1 sulfurtransferase complex subunit TusC [Aliivibrio fischeri]MCE7570217.1 sulfurtransferase complex subunit TusC [Aliivibrio fischeri]
MNRLGFVFQSAPHSTSKGREGLDAILAASAYSEDIQIFFIGDGVLQLLKNQEPEKILSRDYISGFKMLELYDLEEIFVCQNAMSNRGIKEEYLLIDVDSISNKDINEKLSQCDQIMVF